PGGNATGVNFFSTEVLAKRMQLLRELVPAAKSVALLVNPTEKATESTRHEVEALAGGLRILVREASTIGEMPPLRAWWLIRPALCSSLQAPSSVRGASNLPSWRRATTFRAPIRRAPPLKRAG